MSPIDRLRRAIPAVLAVLPALVGADVIAEIVGEADSLGDLGGGFVGEGAWRRYLVAPVVAASAAVLFLLPGLALVRGRGTWGLLRAAATSLVVVTSAAAAVDALVGDPLRGRAFGALVLGLAAVASLIPRREEPVDPRGGDLVGGVLLVLPPILLAVLLTPKIYWECFNPDGAHGFETARLAVRRFLPFWDPAAGDIANFPGETSFLFAWPASWFMRLFGENEAAVRLPFLLYLTLMYAAIVGLAEEGAEGRLSWVEKIIVWLGLTVYTATMCYSATYNPYAADMTMPAAQDTLLLFCFLAFALAVLRGAYGWAFLFALLTHASLPNGLMLLGLFFGGAVLFARRGHVRSLGVAALGLAACVAVSRYLPDALAAVDHPLPGGEYGSLKSRFKRLVLTDASRILFLVVPCGILPAVSLFRWKRLDGAGRAFAFTALAYFAFFYVQQIVSLHHFAPAMVIPLVVHWRLRARSEASVAWTSAAAVCAAAALWLSWPPSPAPHLTGRELGRTVVDLREGYDEMAPSVFDGNEVLYELFPPGMDPRVPEDSYGGSANVWAHYARRDGRADEASYVLTDGAAPSPAGTERLAEANGTALHVRSKTQIEADRARRPERLAAARIYRIPRRRLFPGRWTEKDPAVLELRPLLEKLGVLR